MAILYHTVCPRSSYPFYIVNYYTSWTYNTKFLVPNFTFLLSSQINLPPPLPKYKIEKHPIKSKVVSACKPDVGSSKKERSNQPYLPCQRGQWCGSFRWCSLLLDNCRILNRNRIISDSLPVAWDMLSILQVLSYQIHVIQWEKLTVTPLKCWLCL